MFEISEIIGMVGLGILLLAFALNHGKHKKRFSFTYNGLNLIGSLMLVYYAYTINAIVFIILNITWAFIALYFIVKKIKNRGRMTVWEGFTGEGGLKSDLRKDVRNQGIFDFNDKDKYSPWFK
ncbi:MAG: hypothetical protein V1672_00125 [Candidatus Diapherotrites archaeon]